MSSSVSFLVVKAKHLHERIAYCEQHIRSNAAHSQLCW